MKEQQVSDDQIMERFWENPKNILNLIDLLFLWEDEDGKVIPS